MSAVPFALSLSSYALSLSNSSLSACLSRTRSHSRFLFRPSFAFETCSTMRAILFVMQMKRSEIFTRLNSYMPFFMSNDKKSPFVCILRAILLNLCWCWPMEHRFLSQEFRPANAIFDWDEKNDRWIIFHYKSMGIFMNVFLPSSLSSSSSCHRLNI